MPPRPPISTLFPYTTLFRSIHGNRAGIHRHKGFVRARRGRVQRLGDEFLAGAARNSSPRRCTRRSEEHTSELQSHSDLVCRLLLEKKKHEDRTRGVTQQPV